MPVQTASIDDDAAETDSDAIEVDEDEDEIVSETDRAIEKVYESGRLRVVQDRNDFFLPHVVDFIRGRKWGNLRPPYQRRLRWDERKKSKLIESFIMNVPVPPVFLFENSAGRYEVMDGQQRLNCVDEFMSGEFALSGLRIWPALNNRKFADLPPAIRRGLERSKISAITLTTDDHATGKPPVDVRAQVFERLNTGGEKLNQQELRNCLYSGRFNDMLVGLSSKKQFTDAWDIPQHDPDLASSNDVDERLSTNKLYASMGDCQIVLRYFAFSAETLAGSTKKLLDDCMKSNRNLPEPQIEELKSEFVNTLEFAVSVFGSEAFRLPPTPKKARRTHSRPLYDAQMIALKRQMHRKDEILAAKEKIRAAIDKICLPTSEVYETIVGRPNTANAISKRISTVEAVIVGCL